MSKKEEVQTNIGLLQNLILAFLGALFAVCGFAFLQRKELNLLRIYLFSCCGCAFVGYYLLFWCAL